MSSQINKILVVGPSWVGDTVMAQCLFKVLKQQHPTVQIDVLAPAWTFSLLSRMSEVTNVIELPFGHGELKLLERYRFAKTLKNKGYDQAIIAPNSFKSALIPWLAGIPKRTGWARECRSILLNDARTLDKKRYALMIEQYMALGLPAGAPLPTSYPYPEFQVNTASQQAVLAKHKPHWRGRPVLAVCAGAEFGPSKRWPEAHYAEVAKQKIQEGWDVWLFGSPKDNAVNERIMELTEQRCENLSGRTTLAETIDLLSLASGVVTNDSGLMHVACALKKPVAAIYGSTSPKFTPPLFAQANIIKLDLDCQPCFQRVCPLKHNRCMTELTPDRVLRVMTSWSAA